MPIYETSHKLKLEDTSSDTDTAQTIDFEPQLKEQNKTDPVQISNSKKMNAHSKHEHAAKVVDYLRKNGPTKVVELVRNINDVYCSSNPWVKMAQLCKVNPNIRKFKNGTFKYVAPGSEC